MKGWRDTKQRQGHGCGWGSDALTAAWLLATLLCSSHCSYIHIFLTLAYHVIMRTQNSNKILGPREKSRATVSETDGCCIGTRVTLSGCWCRPELFGFPTHTPHRHGSDSCCRQQFSNLEYAPFHLYFLSFFAISNCRGPGQIVCKFCKSWIYIQANSERKWVVEGTVWLSD